jgi:hypothetical protein
MGLVDAMKAFGGGPSRFGFKFIQVAVLGLVPPANDGPTAFAWPDIEATLKANWINGVPATDQKARAKALIHLRLTKGNAPTVAARAGVNPTVLESVASKATTGETVMPAEIAVLGQADAVISAVLDEAYERADQHYRNCAKLLAVAGGWIIYGNDPAGAADLWGYFKTRTFGLALLVGLSAAPLAPVAKDLASSLQAAASAVGAAKKLVS